MNFAPRTARWRRRIFPKEALLPTVRQTIASVRVAYHTIVRHDLAGFDALRAIAILLVIFARLFAFDMPFAAEQFNLAASNAGVRVRLFSIRTSPLPMSITGARPMDVAF